MLIHHVERYVDFRHKLGVGFEEGEHTLTLFARYADEHGDSHVTVERIHEWCSQACSPERARTKYNLLRRFSLFLRAEDPGHAAPPIGAFGCRRRPRPAPHLLQTEQIAAIISAALTLPDRKISACTYHYLFGLLAVTGMRVSEALALQRSDLTRDGLLVRRSKGGGSRLLPIHSTTRDAVGAYPALLCGFTRRRPLWFPRIDGRTNGRTQNGSHHFNDLCRTPVRPVRHTVVFASQVGP